MPEEQIAPVKADSSSKEGTSADPVLTRLDAMSESWNKRWGEMAARFDAFEKKDEPPPEKNESEGKSEGKSEGAPPEKKTEDAPADPPLEEERHEGPRDEKEGKSEPLAADTKSDNTLGVPPRDEKTTTEGALKDERNENGLTKNDCDTTENPMPTDTTKADAQNNELLRKRLDLLEARLPSELPEGERLKFVRVQERAERVRLAFGDSAGASPALRGESLNQYRRRLLIEHQKHSIAWKDKDVSKIDDDGVLSAIEDQVYSDAMKAARNPSDIPEGSLRMVTEEDETGRRHRKFFGDPEACWGPFKQPAKSVVGWNNKGH